MCLPISDARKCRYSNFNSSTSLQGSKNKLLRPSLHIQHLSLCSTKHFHFFHTENKIKMFYPRLYRDPHSRNQKLAHLIFRNASTAFLQHVIVSPLSGTTPSPLMEFLECFPVSHTFASKNVFLSTEYLSICFLICE